MQQLQACLNSNSTFASRADLLRSKLLQVCKAGGDVKHPNGASTVAGTVPSGGHASFKDATKGVFGISTLDMFYASASPVVEDEIRKRATGYTATPYDKIGYQGLLHDLPGYNGLRYTQAGTEVTANVLMTIKGGVSLIKLTVNPFKGLTPGQAGVMGEDLMFEALTAKYAGQKVTITQQVYFKMFGGGMRADAVVTW